VFASYPGSPELGAVVYHPHRVFGYKDMYFKQRNPNKTTTSYIFYTKEEITDFPKFWKKI
jgi:hypothetical protein